MLIKRWTKSCAVAVIVSLMSIFVAAPSASAASKYRYDCAGRSGNHVVAAFWAQAPNGSSDAYKVTLECGVPGPFGWGINHMVNPDGTSFDDEPARQHFGGYLSDWEAYAIAKTLQTLPWIQPSGRQLYFDDIPIFLPNDLGGEQRFFVVVDSSVFPATIKTGWGLPEDIRNITGEKMKTRGVWHKPADFSDLVLDS